MSTTTSRRGGSKTRDAQPPPVDEEISRRQVVPSNGGPPALTEDLEALAGAGSSALAADNLVPFIVVLQKGNPEVNRKDPAYVQGAEAGMLMDRASLRLWRADAADGDDAGMLAMQAHSERHEIEWVPRSRGGGFVAQHPWGDPALLRSVRLVQDPGDPSKKRPMRLLPSGNQLVDTAYHYLILPETLEPVVVALSSTGLQSHRSWNTMYQRKKIWQGERLLVYPSWYTLIRLQTAWQKNDQGDWFGLVVRDLGLIDKSTPLPGDLGIGGGTYASAFATARAFWESALRSGVRVAVPPTDAARDGAGPGGPEAGDPGPTEDDSPL